MKGALAQRRKYLAVELSHVHLVRGARRVLRNLDWRIAPGQRWVLLGDNGVGKTQLLKLVAGDVWPQPRDATLRRYRWRGATSDEPYGVKDEIAYLGAERQDRYQHYDWNFRAGTVVGTGCQRSDTPLGPLSAVERSRVARLMRRLRIEALANRRFLALSQGERRLVLLARALAWRPALLLLDEPLNGLDEWHRERVMAAIEGLGDPGLPWVYATQHANEAPANATHWARLRDGRLHVGPLRARRLRVGRVRVGRLREPRPPRSPPPRARGARVPAFELRRATVWREGRAALRQLSLEIHPGDCWFVHGPNGSGKSTLLGALLGEHAVAAGGRILRGARAPGTALADFQRRVGYVGPELQAVLPRKSTALDVVVAATRGSHVSMESQSPGERRRAVRALRCAGALGLARRTLGELSYGQARRVLFARALALDPDILLLDEPYTGLDEPRRTQLRRLVDAASRRGCTIVMATHRRADLPRRTTHELELAAGRARYRGPLRPAPRPRARSRS